MRYLSLLLAMLCVLGVIGCTKVVYLEEETPAGHIPPPPAASPAAVPTESPLLAAPPSAPQAVAPSSAREAEPGPKFSGGPGGVMRAETAPAESREVSSAGSIERFRLAYVARRKPRIAVFLNRGLSDEVREWSADTRLALSGGYTARTSRAGKPPTRKDVTGGVTAAIEEHNETAPRPSPRERWMWAFEDGFLQPFLAANARVVDRATIMRLAAAKSADEEGAYAPVSVKRIEMDALKSHADLLVEILIRRSPSSLYGYEFKASAKEVNTGIVVANVTSLRWCPENRKQREVRATSNGYEVVDSVKIPPVENIAADLSTDLMNALAAAWGQ